MAANRASRSSLVRTVAVVVALVTGVAVVAGCESPYPTHARSEHVILIGFDGFDPAYLARVDTPGIDRLAARGVAGTAAGVMPSYTMPSFTAITTGAWPVHSGAITDWWDRDAQRFVHAGPGTVATTIAEHVRANGGTTAAVRYPSLNGHGVRSGDPEALYASGGPDCSTRFDTAIDILHRRPVVSGSSQVTVPQVPTFLAVYCSELDDIGHAEGAESPAIDTALADMDTQVGRLLDALDELDLADDTTVILTGDHGMASYTGFGALPIHDALTAAGYTMSYLWVEGQEPTVGTDVVLVPFGGRGFSVYLVGALAGDEAALADIRSILEGLDEIDVVYDRDAQAGLLMHPDLGDLVVMPADGWGDDVPQGGPLGGHGSIGEATTVFVAGGAGIVERGDPVGVFLVNVGPTIAYLLGLDPLPDADGGPAFDVVTADT